MHGDPVTRRHLRRNVPKKAERGKRVWNSLEVAKLLVAMLVPVTLAIAGYVVNATVREGDEARAEAQRKLAEDSKRAEAVTERERGRVAALRTLARSMFAVVARADLIVGTFRAEEYFHSVDRTAEGLRLYEAAYESYRSDLSINLRELQALAREEWKGGSFEDLIVHLLDVPTLQPLHRCIQRAKNDGLSRTAVKTQIEECGATDLVKHAKDCSRALVAEVDLATSPFVEVRPPPPPGSEVSTPSCSK